MAPRLRVRSRLHRGRYVPKLDGEVDGSTACRALEARAHTPPGTREVVLDLSALRTVEAFVFTHGLRRLTRERRVSIDAAPHLLPVVTSLADSLRAEHAP